MADARFCALDDRSLLSLEGEEAVSFLQGIVTNDVDALGIDRAVYAALLTPQGKYLHDFILVRLGDRVLIDAPAARLDELRKRLSMYKLRARVTIADDEDHAVFAAFGDDAFAALSLDGEAGLCCPRNDGAVYIDPRLKALGLRAVLPRAVGAALLQDSGLAAVPRAEYDAHRMALGVADGLKAESLYPLEAGFDELNAISFTKGCYVGQEVTARMKNRKLVKKRIVPLTVEAGSVTAGDEIRTGDRVAGEIIAAADGTALAMVRLDALDDGAAFSCGTARLTPHKPDWTAF